MRSFLWFVPIGLAVLVMLIALDIYIVNRAKDELMKTSAHFEERYAEVELNFEGPEKQGCQITAIFLFNAYQTCFFSDLLLRDPGAKIRSFTYVFHPPRPLFLGYGKTKDSYYFSHLETGMWLKYIDNNTIISHD